MRYFCVTLGNEDSGYYFYVVADRVELGVITCINKPGDVRFYLGSRLVCFVDHHKVYEIGEIIDEDLEIIFKGGDFV